MATYSAPARTDITLISTTATSGQWNGYTVLHAEGCSHALRGDDIRSFDGVEAVERYVDDFYAVAPCAKAKRTR